jgi:hypothetical protein
LTRIDTRPHVSRVLRGVQAFGSSRIHAVNSDSVRGTKMECGANGFAAPGSRKRINCPRCLAELETVGYAL